ncbi:MAG: alkene reductase [Planctomycetota bacterium]|jgi:2,4-dienoyl-CoA reductase-like NADH-dependent reductase (Old Yellow Enzyme family)
MSKNILEPARLGSLQLANRIVMAPMTRSMAGAGLVPTEQSARYYARRHEAGLIITEATIIRPDGQGYPDTPGIFDDEQVEGWRNVTRAVHKDGGLIFLQLWHVGRVSHPHYLDGALPVAPSAVPLSGRVPRSEFEYGTPRALGSEEVEALIDDFAAATVRAREAGFDGVEIHGANGYLIDQFLHHHTNRRDDAWGGSPEKMTRFALAVTDAVVDAWEPGRVGIRLSPGAYFNMEADERDRAVFERLLPELDRRGLAYVHVGIFDDAMTFDELDGMRATEFLRKHYDGTLIGCGSYTAESGAESIAQDKFDLLAIGRPFIANPDLVSKLRAGESLVDYDAEMLTTLE